MVSGLTTPELGGLEESARGLADTRLVDLGFPCHLACQGCDRTPERPGAYHEGRRRGLAALHTHRADTLRLVFFGGDLFALPASFEDLLEELAEEARAQGIVLEGVAVSDGTSWTLDRVRRFAGWGLATYHVPLDGPAAFQNRARPARTGGSYERILNSLLWHRGGIRVVLHADGTLPGSALDELRSALEREGLLRGSDAVELRLGARRSCRQLAAALAAERIAARTQLSNAD